ncbi:MAG: DUF4398 domain-containing protein [Gammaproteobacteria bacterium]|nr:DUF4398 domain-containing protein [Gammaproteobacteria bacterium]
MHSTRLKSFLQGALLASALVMAGCETSPPVQEMSDARQAIAVAKEAGAEERAAIHLKAAESYLKSAEEKISERQFQQARYDAKQAKIKALDALRAAEASGGQETDESP